MNRSSSLRAAAIAASLVVAWAPSARAGGRRRALAIESGLGEVERQLRVWADGGCPKLVEPTAGSGSQTSFSRVALGVGVTALVAAALVYVYPRRAPPTTGARAGVSTF